MLDELCRLSGCVGISTRADSPVADCQTQLNYPRVTQFVKKTALGFRVSRKHRSSAYATFGLRLWRKLRKRLHGQCKQFAIKDCRQLAWNILYDLGSHTRASFDAARMVMWQQDWRNSDLCCLIQAAWRWQVLPVHFSLAKLIGRLGREPFSMHGSNDTDFLSHCMVSLKAFVMSNGLLLILRPLKTLVDSPGLKSKESNPSCARNSFFTTKIIIPIMWSATALNFA